MYAVLTQENICCSYLTAEEFSNLPDTVTDRCIVDESGEHLGWRWTGKKWVDPPEPEPIVPVLPPTNKELRINAYETLTEKEDGTVLIPWRGKNYTVNGGMADWEHYYKIEADAQALADQIVTARAYIRGLYPEEV